MAFWRSYGHLVWATKNRSLFINETIEARLYAQLVNKASEMECYVYAINGMPDHVHIALSIPPKHSVAGVVKMLKGTSSHFVNHILKPSHFYFAWQRGYGYFSIGESQLAKAVAYIQNQKEHHARSTINSWLEKTAELDEGPPFDGASSPGLNLMRDEGQRYLAQRPDDWPF